MVLEPLQNHLWGTRRTRRTHRPLFVYVFVFVFVWKGRVLGGEEGGGAACSQLGIRPTQGAHPGSHRSHGWGWQRPGLHDTLVQSMSAITVLFLSSMAYTSCAEPKHLMCKGTLHALHMYAVVVVRQWLYSFFPPTFTGACTTCVDMVNAHHLGAAENNHRTLHPHVRSLAQTSSVEIGEGQHCAVHANFHFLNTIVRVFTSNCHISLGTR